MSGTGTISLLIIIINVIVSYQGFKNGQFLDNYKFEVDKILVNREYKRLVTSGFLHVSWSHLIFNMLSLYFFSGALEFSLGPGKFLVIYFASLIGGDLFSLFIHRHHGDYSSVGASGAVSGIIFACIALFPGMNIGFFGIISIPSWLYGLIFVLASIYGVRSQKDNVGHDAHLAGALVGLIVAIIMHPSSVSDNLVPILVISIPSILFIYIIITRPHFLLVDNFFFKTHRANLTLDQRYNAERKDRQKEVDRILEKIHQSGIKSLSKKEREILNEYSKKS
jgi:membrane associated rhomboid family serine protease